MSKKFLFPMKGIPPSVNELLKGLAAAEMVTCYSMIMAVTDSDIVAALLEKLDTAEEIVRVYEPVKPAEPEPSPSVVTKTEKRKYHRPPMPDVECPVCRRPVSPMYMLKDGSMCKMCSMKAKKAAAQLPHSEPMLDRWTNQKPEFGKEEHLADVQARPKEKIKLDNLSGKRLG
jgi:ribosomal protein L24E